MGFRGWMVTGVCVFGMLGCSSGSRLPDAAAPQRMGEIDPAAVVGGDIVSYRALTRSDFKAAEPPRQVATIAKQVGAATCAYLMTDPRLMIYTKCEPTDDDDRCSGSVKNLRFVAVMDRQCSWWNPEPLFPTDYLLQHEQIHFALFELKARELNASLESIAEYMQVEGPSEQDAKAKVQQMLNQHMEEAMEATLARNREFDEETSMGVHKEAQASWHARITSELESTSQWANKDELAKSAGANTED